MPVEVDVPAVSAGSATGDWTSTLGGELPGVANGCSAGSIRPSGGPEGIGVAVMGALGGAATPSC
jgi:hypothetical protein